MIRRRTDVKKKHNFKFLTKIRLFYASVLLLAVLSFGLFLRLSYMRDFEEATVESGQQLCRELSINLNTYIESMDDISKKVLSDSSLRSLLRTVEDDIANDSVFDSIERERQIASAITGAVSLSAFPSLNVYIYSPNRTYMYVYNQSNSNFEKILSVPGNMEQLHRKQLLVYTDEPSEESSRPGSISFVRAIFDVSGNHYGYVEVQSSLKTIHRICEKENIKNILLFSCTGDLIYSYYPAEQEFVDLIRNGKDAGVNENEVQENMIFCNSIDNIDGTVCMIYSADAFFSSFRAIQRTTYAFLLCVVAFGFAVLYYMSRRLVRPLHELRDRVKAVTYENVGLEFQSGNNEIMDLKESFQAILSNLKEKTERELILKQAESDARLAAMQDQISPHFIRNVLYSISITAKEGYSEKASVMCKQLADMMCYTVDSNNQSVTAEEEFHCISNYLSLEKIYYEDFLEYEISLAPEIQKIVIPRLSIQPFVENAIQHAFAGCKPPYEIIVRGFREEEWWIIEVSDNGTGFDEAERDKIFTKIKTDISKATIDENSPQKNGIGIVNTILRMKLFFDDDIDFQISDKKPESGTVIRIAGRIV